MAEWSLPDLNYPLNQLDSYQYATYPSYPSCQQHDQVPRVPRLPYCPQPQAQLYLPAAAGNMALHFAPQLHYGSSTTLAAKGESPREVRNRAEKMRRDRLNKSVAELASMVPPVVAARRKIDKTTVLRLTAHYLRAHQYVFGDSIDQSRQRFSPASILKAMSLFNGFLITTTYRGIIVVVSQNVNEYLGYSELDLLGQNLFNITHEGDRAMLREQLLPRTQTLGPNGELMIPDEPDATRKAKEALAHEKRRFVIRLKKLGQRSEPNQYVTCHVEGSLRKSDRACRGYNRCCQIVRRARARSENPCSSGNDIVFIGIVRPTSESFINETAIESYRMEYRTRHSIDGEIIQCESRIALVTGYMTHEVSGVNAMNFMHRDDVRWVIIALREMYDQHRVFGESCYRLITKNGQMVYMRTRGCLDVDRESRAVTTFVCTNTVVSEEEGKQLIKLMKKKFTMLVNNTEGPTIEEIDNDTHDVKEQNEDEPAPVEDPKRLEQVILHLVTNLPSPAPKDGEDEPFAAASPEKKNMSPHRLTIIPPNKERIVSAIEKIYGIIPFQKDLNYEDNRDGSAAGSSHTNTVPFQKDLTYEDNRDGSAAGSSHTTPQYIQPLEINNVPAPREVQIAEQDAHTESQLVPLQSVHVSNSTVPFQKDLNYEDNRDGSAAGSSHTTPQYIQPIEINNIPAPREVQIEGQDAHTESQLVPLQSVHVSNYVQTPDSSLVPLTDYYSDNDNNSDSILNAIASPDMGYFDVAHSPFSNISMLSNNIENGEEVFNELQVADMQDKYRGAETEINMPQNAEELNVCKVLPETSSSNFFSCGTKRPNDFEDDMIYKKKITEMEYFRQSEPISHLPITRVSDEVLCQQNKPDSGVQFFQQNKEDSNLELHRKNESDSDLEFRQQELLSDLGNQSFQDHPSLKSPLAIFADESIFNGDQIEFAVCTMDLLNPTLPDLQGSDVEKVLDEIEKEAEQESRIQEFHLEDYE